MFGPALAARRAELVDALASCGGGDERLLGVGGAHLARAQSANTALLGAPTLPAGRRYTGVVWDHLGLATLPAAARRRATRTVVVLSGLLGAVGVDDPTPDYRLKMAARLTPMGALARWWRDPLSAALDEHLAGRFVVDLLPNEHRTAWRPDVARLAGLVSVAFVERSGKTAGHDAKAAKGRLARHLLLATDAEAALASWHDDRFDLRVTAS